MQVRPDIVVRGEQRLAEDGQQHRAHCNEQCEDHGFFLSSPEQGPIRATDCGRRCHSGEGAGINLFTVAGMITKQWLERRRAELAAFDGPSAVMGAERRRQH